MHHAIDNWWIWTEAHSNWHGLVGIFNTLARYSFNSLPTLAVKSKRSRSGATKLPFWSASAPRTWRRPKLSKWVAVWLFIRRRRRLYRQQSEDKEDRAREIFAAHKHQSASVEVSIIGEEGWFPKSMWTHCMFSIVNGLRQVLQVSFAGQVATLSLMV